MHIELIEESNLSNWETHLKNTFGSSFLSAPWLESLRDQKCYPLYFRFVCENNTLGIAAGLSLEPRIPCVGKFFRILFSVNI